MELTFRELIESCDIDHCTDCLLVEWCQSVENNWYGDKSPCRINVDEIEQKYFMRKKEKENAKNKENNNGRTEDNNDCRD